MSLQLCPNQRRVIHMFLLFIFLWQSLYRVSDAAVTLVLRFVVRFLSLNGSCLGVEALYRLSQKFPHTLYRAKKFLGRLQERFVRYVSCPTCHKINYTQRMNALKPTSEGENFHAVVLMCVILSTFRLECELLAVHYFLRT